MRSCPPRPERHVVHSKMRTRASMSIYDDDDELLTKEGVNSDKGYIS